MARDVGVEAAEDFVYPHYLSFIEHKYQALSSLGEGTFSFVFKALCKRTNRLVALKAITRSSSPSRILDELNVLKALNGENNCIGLLEVLRHQDQIVMVFPLIQSIDFKDFILKSTIIDMKRYLYCLISAVRHMHSKGIIHRDIKPGNFLYDLDSGEGYLIDFGLAQYEKTKVSSPVAQTKTLIFFNSIVTQSRPPGYYEKDSRPQMRAPRAGTRGFRAPEVLFRVPNQTKAIDMWSVGVVFLCILTGQYPFYLSMDDVDGLVETAIIFGNAEIRKAAKHYGRTWASNIETIGENRIPFELLVKKMNPDFVVDTDAIDLLYRLLDLNCETRISAAEALEHPFLANM